VQGVLESALSQLLGQAIRVIGAGRTDTGVHAIGQVISFQTTNPLAEGTIRRGVNALLPGDVAAQEVREVPPDFHARFSATARTYSYTIWNAQTPRPLLRRIALWVDEPLDVAAMERAAAHIYGRHDFSAFGRPPGRTAERTVRRASWLRSEDGRLVFEIEADAFLRGMVRALVGTFLRVGRGKMSAEELGEALHSRDRARAGPAAAAHGLCLVGVSYDGSRTSDHDSEEDE
jgi:tRNA pseudouridine38-40 synthase